jgi:hypothetical protein
MTACYDNRHVVGTSVAGSSGGAPFENLTEVCNGMAESCVSADVAGGRGGTGPVAAAPETRLLVLECWNGIQLPPFNRGCQADEDCAFVWHVWDPCGSKTAVGLSREDQAAFEQALLVMCTLPGNCQVGEPTLRTEDGQRVPAGPNPPGVVCVDQACSVFPG